MLDSVAVHAPSAARGQRSVAPSAWGASPPPSHVPFLQLQASAGNRAVTELLGRLRPPPVVQRCGPVPCNCAGEDGDHRPASDDTTDGSTVQRIGEDITAGFDPDAAAPTDAGTPTLSIGSQGPSVRALQEQLNLVEPAPDPRLDPDGIFGEQTLHAVETFQEARGLDADGIVGPNTREALVAASPPGEPAPLAAVGGPPLAVPETADEPCPPYTDEEKNGEHPGGRLDFGEGGERADTALVFDFAPGKSDITDTHARFLREITERFKLGDRDSPIERITVLEGFTDCQGFAAGKAASTGINASIRQTRAIAVKLALDKAGAKLSNVPAVPTASGEKGGPGDNATVEGRRLNRSVRIGLERRAGPPPELPGPPGEGPGAELCSIGLPFLPQQIGEKSDEWSLTSHVSGSLEAVFIGVTGTGFTLTDTKSGRRFPALFTGLSGGLSTPFEFQVSIPSATTFKTPKPVCPDDFNGLASIVTKFSVPVIPGFAAGVMKGDIILDEPTIPVGIDIGSKQVGVGASTGVAEGTFVVIETPF